MENAIMWATENLQPHYEFVPTSYALNQGIRMTATLMPFKPAKDLQGRSTMVFGYGINQTVSFVELERIARSCISQLIANGTISAITPDKMGGLSSEEIAKIMTCCIDNTHEQKSLIMNAISEELYKGVSYIPKQPAPDRNVDHSEAMVYIWNNLMLKWGSALVGGKWTVMMSPFGPPDRIDRDKTFEHGNDVFDIEELGCRVLTVIYEYIMRDSPYGTEYARQNAELRAREPGPMQWGIMAVLNCTSRKISEDLRKDPRFNSLMLSALSGENHLEDVERQFEEFMNKALYNKTTPTDARFYMYRYFKPHWTGRVTNGGNRWSPNQLHLGFDPFDDNDRPRHYGNVYELDGTLCADIDMCRYVTAAFLKSVNDTPHLLDAFQRIFKRYKYRFADDENAYMLASELTVISQDMVNDCKLIDAMYKNLKPVTDDEFGKIFNELMNKMWQ